MNKHIILDKVSQYLHWLSIPLPEFNNIAVCPFIEKELSQDKLWVDIWYPHLNSLLELVESFLATDKNSALIICQDTEDLKWERVERSTIQRNINTVLRSNPTTEYLKCIVISPYEDFEVAGVKTRESAPYFMINIIPTKQLGKAHKDLNKTRYFDNFTDQDKKLMKVKES